MIKPTFEIITEKYLKIHISKILVCFDSETMMFINFLLVIISDVYFMNYFCIEVDQTEQKVFYYQS